MQWQLVSGVDNQAGGGASARGLPLRGILQHRAQEDSGRNSFNPSSKIKLRQNKLELWPGYETSIRQHEHDLLLCVEITHKVLRTDTVLDLLR